MIDIICWSVLLLLFTGGVFLSILASRTPTAQKPGPYWLIIPVVVLVVTTIIFVAAFPDTSAPGMIFQLAATGLLLLIGIVGGSPLVLVTLDLAGSSTVPLGEHGGILVGDEGTNGKNREILRGGLTIGYLERLIIMGAALIGQYAAVAIVVAVKGLGRFSELENSAARERFIIGTLVSIVWAAACVTPIIVFG